MKMRNIIYAVISILTVLGLICGIAASAHGKSDIDAIQTDEYLDERAGEYCREIREYLNDEAFLNAGITMTYVTDEGAGTRTYTILLHHKKFDSLTLKEKETISDRIGKMAFFEENCGFEVIFDEK